jgi:hypothetical protein
MDANADAFANVALRFPGLQGNILQEKIDSMYLICNGVHLSFYLEDGVILSSQIKLNVSTFQALPYCTHNVTDWPYYQRVCMRSC